MSEKKIEISPEIKPKLKEIKIGILPTYTPNNIIEPLKQNLEKNGLLAEVKLGGYNQINQELLNTNSWIYDNNFEILLVLLSTRSFFPNLEYDIITKDYELLLEECTDKIKTLLDSLEFAVKKQKVLITNFEVPFYSPYTYDELKNHKGINSIILECNKLIYSKAREVSFLEVFDFPKFCFEIGKENLTDEKMYYLGKILFKKLSSEKFAKRLSEQISTIMGKRKKVIVVDLDNTLWGGVIGEDGVANLKLGGNGAGEIYSEVQKILKNYKETGTLLAIVSKNNYEDVEPIFNSDNMILKKDDFVTYRINWELKSKNILDIAEELNLGVDSFIFLDDNPAERYEVKERIPSIDVIDFPEDIALLPLVLKDIAELKATSYTKEDKKRHEMYALDKKRNEIKSASVSVEDYLKKLEIKIKVSICDKSQLTRITQLINKTNQFNLRTRRYTEEEVSSMMNSEKFIVSSVTVYDKFGELGLTGVIIIENTSKNNYFIDSFLISCRVMSRGIEKQFLIETLKEIKKTDLFKLNCEYLKTPKNSPVLNFYEELGFEVLEKDADGNKKYLCNAQIYKNLKSVNWIEVLKNG